MRFVALRGSDLDPARLAGVRVGVMSATVSADRLAQNFGDRVSVRLFRDRAAVDAIMGGGLGSRDRLAGPVARPFGSAGVGHRLDQGIGIAARHQDRALLRRPNRALRAIFANGAYERINAR